MSPSVTLPDVGRLVILDRLPAGLMLIPAPGNNELSDAGFSP